MLLPIRPKEFLLRVTPPRFIILHDQNCMYNHTSMTMIKPAISKARTFNWILNQQIDLNYHYVFQKLGEDYECLTGRPFNRLCTFDDIPDVINRRAIHVCLLGDYNIMRPTARLYTTLCYKTIVPLLLTFKIKPSNVFLHNKYRKQGSDQCPGHFINRQLFKAYLNSNYII